MSHALQQADNPYFRTREPTTPPAFFQGITPPASSALIAACAVSQSLVNSPHKSLLSLNWPKWAHKLCNHKQISERERERLHFPSILTQLVIIHLKVKNQTRILWHIYHLFLQRQLPLKGCLFLRKWGVWWASLSIFLTFSNSYLLLFVWHQSRKKKKSHDISKISPFSSLQFPLILGWKFLENWHAWAHSPAFHEKPWEN